jgi:hypothetical protein
MTNFMLSRRTLAAGIAFLPFLIATARAQAPAPAIRVHKDPTCGCCGGWIAHMRAANFSVTVAETSDLAAVKKRLAVPERLASCHTGEIGRYVIEGHVPASVILRFLAEMPGGAYGLAVPDMPIGSPGMEVPGTKPDTYDVIMFGNFGQRRYARFEGAREIAL